MGRGSRRREGDRERRERGRGGESEREKKRKERERGGGGGERERGIRQNKTFVKAFLVSIILTLTSGILNCMSLVTLSDPKSARSTEEELHV